jgi:hypothetical protein
MVAIGSAWATTLTTATEGIDQGGLGGHSPPRKVFEDGASSVRRPVWNQRATT